MLALQSPSSPDENYLLNALPPDVLQRLLPCMELVYLDKGDVILKGARKMGYAYFPTTLIFSLFNVLKDGTSTEIAIVGSEGFLGITLIMGVDTTSVRAVVQSPGYAFRLRSQLLMNEFKTCESLANQLMLYIQFLLTQTGQNVVCNRHHSILMHLSCWMLNLIDRLPNNELRLTHEKIAVNLGVRRESVTDAIGELQRRNLIKSCRGRIIVLDREQLEEAACECYSVVRNEQHRLFPGLYR